MDIKLLPCPFCGSQAEVDVIGDYDPCYHVSCTNMNCFMCEGPDYGFDSAEEAISAWNHRVPIESISFRQE